MWRNAVAKASNPAQLSLCVSQLNNSISWEKSIMKVVSTALFYTFSCLNNTINTVNSILNKFVQDIFLKQSNFCLFYNGLQAVFDHSGSCNSWFWTCSCGTIVHWGLFVSVDSCVSSVGEMITRLSSCCVTVVIRVTTPTASRSVHTPIPPTTWTASVNSV